MSRQLPGLCGEGFPRSVPDRFTSHLGARIVRHRASPSQSTMIVWQFRRCSARKGEGDNRGRQQTPPLRPLPTVNGLLRGSKPQIVAQEVLSCMLCARGNACPPTV